MFPGEEIVLEAAGFYRPLRFYELGSLSTGLARTDSVLVSDDLLLRSSTAGDVKSREPIRAHRVVTDTIG